MKISHKDQLDLFAWAAVRPIPQPASRPSAQIIDIMPALIGKIAAEPWPPKQQTADIVTLGRSVA